MPLQGTLTLATKMHSAAESFTSSRGISPPIFVPVKRQSLPLFGAQQLLMLLILFVQFLCKAIKTEFFPPVTKAKDNNS